jgi:carbamoyltransferase
LAGGVALNSLANGKIHEFSPFRHFNIHPAAGDDGTATGAALWVGRQGSRRVHLRTASLGNEFGDDEIEQALAARGSEMRFEKLPYEQLIHHTAEAIAEGLVLGWFQGRMEWGPRALGNRSILALPGHPGMKDILNARIKHREWFRPFAPVVLEERLADYFEAEEPEPFMLRVFRTRADKRAVLTAVDHEDHTGRVQTVSRDVNAPYYDVVKKVGELTGTPVVINTSFNENEPIVYSPAEAIDCFLRTKMDRLAIGSYWCTKDDFRQAEQA